MLRLDIPHERRWLDLARGVRFEAEPATTALITTARVRAARQMTDLRKAVEDARLAGLPLQGPDVTDPDIAAGYAFALSCVALARVTVKDWDGIIGADGKPAAFDVEKVPQVLQHPDIAEDFWRQMTAAQDALVAEGNA